MGFFIINLFWLDYLYFAINRFWFCDRKRWEYETKKCYLSSRFAVSWAGGPKKLFI